MGDDTSRMVGRDGDAGTVEQDGVRIGARGPAGARGWACDRVQRELQELPMPALRRRRELLSAEVRRAGHWARLVRARRDLLVAVAVDVEDLAVPVEAGVAGGPLEVLLGVGDLLAAPAVDTVPSAAVSPLGAAGLVDPGHDLRGLVLSARGDRAVPGDSVAVPLVGQLQDLAAAARRLAEYEEALSAELALATDVFLERCAALFGGVQPTDPTHG